MSLVKKVLRSGYHFMLDSTVNHRLNTGFWRSITWTQDWVCLHLKHFSNPFILDVPANIVKPRYCIRQEAITSTAGDAEIHKPPFIAAMRKTCRIAANVLNKCEQLVEPGTSTDEINKFAHYELIKANAYPSPLGYMDFKKSIFASPNNVICLGIPNERRLQEGDNLILSIFAFANSVHGSCTKTYLIGNVAEKLRSLNECSELCLDEIVKLCGPGVPFYKVADLTQQILNETYYRAVHDFSMNGIGRNIADPPTIYYEKNDDKRVMKPGMIFRIGPIIVSGSPYHYTWQDNWTIATADHHPASQFQHTILITEDGCEILTIPDE